MELHMNSRSMISKIILSNFEPKIFDIWTLHPFTESADLFYDIEFNILTHHDYHKEGLFQSTKDKHENV